MGELYDEDILVWSERQAAALRSLASRRDLPNELDLANVIEEIEDVGRSEFHAVESYVENILVHLILLWSDPDAPAVRGWIAEIAAWDAALGRRLSPAMRTRLDMGALWRQAQRLSALKMAVWDEGKAAAIAKLADTPCPLLAQELPFGEIDIRSLSARISAA